MCVCVCEAIIKTTFKTNIIIVHYKWPSLCTIVAPSVIPGTYQANMIRTLQATDTVGLSHLDQLIWPGFPPPFCHHDGSNSSCVCPCCPPWLPR